MHLLVALSLLVATGGAGQHERAAAATSRDPQLTEVDRITTLIGSGKPAEALAALDMLIAAQEKARASDARRAYCARGEAETQAYEKAGRQEGKPFVILPQAACYSYFLKGFALIDLQRSEEARSWLERATAMAPSNAHFLGELAEWYKMRKDWAKSRELFGRAVDASDLSPKERQVFDKTRGMRGLGYILIEEGKLDEAEALYRRCLALDPKDERSKRQLDYIAGQRGKKI